MGIYATSTEIATWFPIWWNRRHDPEWNREYVLKCIRSDIARIRYMRSTGR